LDRWCPPPGTTGRFLFPLVQAASTSSENFHRPSASFTVNQSNVTITHPPEPAIKPMFPLKIGILLLVHQIPIDVKAQGAADTGGAQVVPTVILLDHLTGRHLIPVDQHYPSFFYFTNAIIAVTADDKPIIIQIILVAADYSKKVVIWANRFGLASISISAETSNFWK
jgi:hypothetical protein